MGWRWVSPECPIEVYMDNLCAKTCYLVPSFSMFSYLCCFLLQVPSCWNWMVQRCFSTWRITREKRCKHSLPSWASSPLVFFLRDSSPFVTCSVYGPKSTKELKLILWKLGPSLQILVELYNLTHLCLNPTNARKKDKTFSMNVMCHSMFFVTKMCKRKTNIWEETRMCHEISKYARK
jgi:hypothetical protein